MPYHVQAKLATGSDLWGSLTQAFNPGVPMEFYTEADAEAYIAVHYPSRHRADLFHGLQELRVREQPDHSTKLATLNGLDTGWDYRFDPNLLPSTAHTMWSQEDWIKFIGSRWFRKA